MPKERKDRSKSHGKYRGSPLCCESSRALKPSEKQVKEWEEARCPVCMEHPHKGILLICSSYENGCRPYMCNTSHRHSNCFDQFRKASKEKPSLPIPFEQEETNVPTPTEDDVASDATFVDLGEEAESEVAFVDLSEGGEVLEESIVATEEVEQEKNKPPKLTCPLCRGHIKKWVVVDAARCFMNSKHRSCSCEACDFSGTYSELKKHARVQHPGARPSEADPERQRSWRRLERQRDMGDLISTLRSSFGGEEMSNDDVNHPPSYYEGGFLTMIFLIRVMTPESVAPRRSASWSGASRTRSQLGGRRRSPRHWGETYEGGRGTSSRDEQHDQSSDEQESGTRREFSSDDDDEEEET